MYEITVELHQQYHNFKFVGRNEAKGTSAIQNEQNEIQGKSNSQNKRKSSYH